MKMYIWSSEYLKAYGYGTIIVMAENLEEAKNKAILEFDRYDREEYPLDWDDDAGDWDDPESIEYRKVVLLDDIEKTPIISDVLFISGSD